MRQSNLQQPEREPGPERAHDSRDHAGGGARGPHPRRRAGALEAEAAGGGGGLADARRGHGVGDAGGAGHGLAARADLDDVARRRVEPCLGDRDLVIGEVVDDVRAAEEGVAEHVGRGARGRDAEQARRGAVAEGGAAAGARDEVEDELVHVDRDDGLGEVELEGDVGVGLGAGDVRRALGRVVLRRDLVVDGLHHGVGEVRQAGSAVQEHGERLVRGDGVVAHVQARQSNEELGVHAALGLDGQRRELALELIRVHAAEEDRARVGVQVVEPEAVGVGVDLARRGHLGRQVFVRREACPPDLHLVRCVADPEDALSTGALVADAELEIRHRRAAHMYGVFNIVAACTGAVHI